MANKPIKFRIDVTKIAKLHLYKGQKGTYLNCAVWPNKNGPDQNGMTHYITQEVSREAREAGEKGPIIGNLALPEQEQRRTAAPPRQVSPEGPLDGSFDDEDIPF